MTTVVVVRKAGSVAIAADTLATFGDTRLSGAHEANDKVLRVGRSRVGVAGTAAHSAVPKAPGRSAPGTRHAVLDCSPR